MQRGRTRPRHTAGSQSFSGISHCFLSAADAPASTPVSATRITRPFAWPRHAGLVHVGICITITQNRCNAVACCGMPCPYSMQRHYRLPFDVFDLHESHVETRDSLANGFNVGCIVLVCLDVRCYGLRCNQLGQRVPRLAVREPSSRHWRRRPSRSGSRTTPAPLFRLSIFINTARPCSFTPCTANTDLVQQPEICLRYAAASPTVTLLGTVLMSASPHSPRHHMLNAVERSPYQTTRTASPIHSASCQPFFRPSAPGNPPSGGPETVAAVQHAGTSQPVSDAVHPARIPTLSRSPSWPYVNVAILINYRKNHDCRHAIN